MFRFALVLLLLLGNCGRATPFIKVTLEVPPGSTPPTIDTLEVTVSAVRGGAPESRVVVFSAEGQSFPLSFVLTFTQESRGLETTLSMRGLADGQNLLSAEISAVAGEEEVVATVLLCGGGIRQVERGEECD